MKQMGQYKPIYNQRVAPLAGAWIETSTISEVYRVYEVAPLAGAWIETATR